MDNGLTKQKVCMLGAYAVGKTSLARRFLHNGFSDRYTTTVGVKVGRRDLRVEDRPVALLVWDIHGKDEFQEVRDVYLRGASGCFFVVDGTRPETLTTALELRDQMREAVGPVSSVVLLNKSDLHGTWELTREEVANAFGDASVVLETSAKENLGVEDAFLLLAREMLSPTCPTSPARS